MSDDLVPWIIGFAVLATVIIFALRKRVHWQIHRMLHKSFIEFHLGAPPTSGMVELVSCIATLAYAMRHGKDLAERASLARLKEYARRLPVNDVAPVVDWLRNDPASKHLTVAPIAVTILSESFSALVKGDPHELYQQALMAATVDLAKTAPNTREQGKQAMIACLDETLARTDIDQSVLNELRAMRDEFAATNVEELDL